MLSTKLFNALSFLSSLSPFSFLSLRRNVNRSKVSYEGDEIKERYLENFPFVNVSTDCKTFSNFTLPRKPLMTLSLVTLDYHRPVSSSFVLSRSAEQILRHVLREQITDDEHHRSYYSYYYYHYRKNSYNTKKLENHQLLDATQTNKQTNNIHFNRTPRILRILRVFPPI